MLGSMPQELAERRLYLEANKNYRLQYDGLVERLNNWVEEAQLKLRHFDSGVNFANVDHELREHKDYFGQEAKLKELLDEIHVTSNKIWASLEKPEQDKLAHQQEFFNQLLRNTLNSANGRQAALEESAKKWKVFAEVRERVAEAVSAVCVVESERPSSLAGVKSGIARIDSAAKAVNGKKPELEKYNDDAKDLCRMADVVNRNAIREEQDALNGKVKRSLSALKEQKERLAALALQWDDFEQKSKGFGTAIGACRHKIAATVDSTYRSIPQMRDIRSALKKLLDEADGLEGRSKDVSVLSDNVVVHLGDMSETAKAEVREGAAALQEKYRYGW